MVERARLTWTRPSLGWQGADDNHRRAGGSAAALGASLLALPVAAPVREDVDGNGEWRRGRHHLVAEARRFWHRPPTQPKPALGAGTNSPAHRPVLRLAIH
ncbi:hypothetical protein FS749_003262 [Ceratobasidium sp. UAMH 11750]|nr:hypothetical protein FS749_003262 [Ceratobasidium sp. UAMH 11750]